MRKSSERLINYINGAILAGEIRKVDILRATGMSPSVLDAYLNGESTPGLDAADRLAAAVSTSLGGILFEAPVQYSPRVKAIVDRLESFGQKDLALIDLMTIALSTVPKEPQLTPIQLKILDAFAPIINDEAEVLSHLDALDAQLEARPAFTAALRPRKSRQNKK
jgi:transcriptional regulator with XRE-family HTH domain